MNRGVIAKVQTTSDILKDNLAFVVPSYQRPYVWPDEDVLKLLDDIQTAKNSGDSHYYIGTVLTASVESVDKQDKRMELIDGQQRTTTLILIALAFHELGIDTPMARIAVLNEEPRLSFVIRDQVQALLGSWAGLSKYQRPSDEAIKTDPYLTRLYGALRALRQKLERMDENERLDLADYIFNQVQWVNNTVPDGVDLNRLFATMNTSGVQLEQSDILKSLLLKHISTKKAVYEGIWQACEQMENYFERNVRSIFSGSDWKYIKPKDMESYSRSLFKLPRKKSDNIDNDVKLSITDIGEGVLAGNDISIVSGSVDQNSDDGNIVYCRSIISFPLLLMQSYRIYREKHEDITVRLNSDRLIESFYELIHSDEKSVKKFLRVLWQVRYQFDRWVIKWIRTDSDGEEYLGLAEPYLNTSKGKKYIQRRYLEPDALVHLQSVRNFTGERSAQYWLTPFLGWLIDDSYIKAKNNAVLKLLEEIDNDLSLATETQKEASFDCLLGNEVDCEPFDDVLNELEESKGTRFEHYWFQKLEYLLWKAGDKSKDKKLSRYRIVSRNSVEHVYPQKEEYGNKLEREYLDAFGNLVLLSPGQNSSYSNQKVEKKKVDFYSHNNYDSLKLKHMFELMGNDEWSADKIKQHQLSMIKTLSEHYKDYFRG